MGKTISPDQIRAEGRALKALVNLGVTQGLQPLNWLLIPGERITGRMVDLDQPGEKVAPTYWAWVNALGISEIEEDTDDNHISVDGYITWDVDGTQVPVRLSGRWRNPARWRRPRRRRADLSTPDQLRAAAAAAADMAQMTATRCLTPLWWRLSPYLDRIDGLLPNEMPASQMETVAREWGRALGVENASPYRDSWLFERPWQTTAGRTTIRISGDVIQYG